MKSQEVEQRLSRMTTQWSQVLDAHRGTVGQHAPARADLIQRYLGAIYRYLLGAVRDADAAEELCQEFAIRFLQGKFHRASPGRGRFRDYVKTALVNLVNDYHRSRGRWPAALPEGVAEPANAAPAEDDDDGDFVAAWREEILAQTWQSLQESRPVYYAVLKTRIDNPDFTSREIAEHLNQTEGKSLNPAAVRKTLERAHSKFADLLLEEVAGSLDSGTPEQLRAELQALDLLKYCSKALERRGRTD